jgi:hypothetical protein
VAGGEFILIMTTWILNPMKKKSRQEITDTPSKKNNAPLSLLRQTD